MPLPLYVIAFAAGVVLIVQVGVNTTLRTALDAPVLAALLSFLVGSVALVVFLLLSRTAWPARAQWAAIPWWAWFGGILGAFYVVSTIIAGPRLGAAALLALIVLGQLLTSLLVDHFGWLGFPQHPVTALRLLGALLLFGGMLLIVHRG
ncbi:MAG TPA: DMT family transporter [Steroidobacteraceae bacterium]|nr:DMT family transporter [Steroidobacteraceae bacterium]